MRVLRKRGEVIAWAGRVHAYPVVNRAGDTHPDLAQVGADEAALQRVGWKSFFRALERDQAVVAVEDGDSAVHRVIRRDKARAAWPHAFGPPWYVRIWREVNLFASR